MSQLTTIACLAAFAASLHAAGNLLPNPSFEAGKAAPTGWTLQGKGSWAKEGLTGARAIAVEGTGKGNSYWRCALPKLVLGQPQEAGRIDYILNNSFGMLGINAVLIVSRPGMR